VGAIIKTIATKNDIAILRDGTLDELAGIRYELAGLRQDIRKARTEIIKWMFFFCITQVDATYAIFYFFLKKNHLLYTGCFLHNNMDHIIQLYC
jgi:hypothetical protein